MFFKTYTPNAAIAPYVRSYWVLEKDSIPEAPEKILPDGCMELIFHYGDPYRTNIRDMSLIQPLNIVVGQIKKAIHLMPTGKTGIISVRFEPWGFYAITGISAKLLTDNYLEADEVLGDAVITINQQVLNSDNSSRINILDNYLQSLLNARPAGHIARINPYISSLQKLAASDGNIPIATLAADCNVGVRQYNRVINDIIGISPKHYARIVRLHAFLDYYRSDKHPTLTSALYESGYYDQAHFIKEFKAISLTSPSVFFKGNHEMAELMLQ